MNGLHGWLSVFAGVAIGCGVEDPSIPTGDATTTDVGSSDARTSPDALYPDVIFDQPPPYATQVALAYCTRIKNCCAAFDGGTFDYSACVAAVRDQGWENTNAGLGIPGITDRGHVAIDKQSAQACIGGLATMSCPGISSLEVKNLASACNASVVGNQVTGGDCVASIECRSTDYCDLDFDGGLFDAGIPLGRCATLLDSGAACGQGHYEIGFRSDECAYKSGPAPPRFCNYDTRPTKSGYVCATLRADGDNCRADNECQSRLCVEVPDGGITPVPCDAGGCTCRSVVDYGTHLCGLDKAPNDAGAD